MAFELAIVTVLAGIALGLRFKVLIPVPAVAFAGIYNDSRYCARRSDRVDRLDYRDSWDRHSARLSGWDCYSCSPAAGMAPMRSCSCSAMAPSAIGGWPSLSFAGLQLLSAR
jgi:hypothetical protein